MQALQLRRDRRAPRSFFHEIVDLMNEWDRPSPARDQHTFAPACDIHESEKSFEISFDIPGISKDDLTLEVKDHRLIVSGERKEESSSEEKGIRRRERRFGSFKRSFSLPENIDSDAISADFIDGVLKIELPKSAGPEPKTIAINGKQGPVKSVK